MAEFVMNAPSEAREAEPMGYVSYAGFWKRVAAYLIDALVVGVPAMIFLVALILLLGRVDGGPVVIVFGYLLIFIGQWLYCAMMESSPSGATIGKRAMGLCVTDLHGNRLDFARASGRYWGKILSGLIMDIGFIMVAFTDKKQGLHDMMAGTLVLDMNNEQNVVPPSVAEQATNF